MRLLRAAGAVGLMHSVTSPKHQTYPTRRRGLTAVRRVDVETGFVWAEAAAAETKGLVRVAAVAEVVVAKASVYAAAQETSTALMAGLVLQKTRGFAMAAGQNQDHAGSWMQMPHPNYQVTGEAVVEHVVFLQEKGGL